MTYESAGISGVLRKALLVLSGVALAQFAHMTSAAETAPERDAKQLLMDMARSLVAMPTFSVNLRTGYDAVQPSGQKIEFIEKRRIVASRPNQLRVEVDRGDDSQLVTFDGKHISVASTAANVYAQASKPGTIDDAVTYFLRDLKMRLPLALMLVSTLPEELQRRTTQVDYVEESAILGVRAHHLAVRTETVDFQVWMSNGANPMPLRVVLTYKTEAGAPQFWADFSDWNQAPETTDGTFAFVPAKDAQKIPFLTQMAQVASPGLTKPSGSDAHSEGDKK